MSRRRRTTGRWWSICSWGGEDGSPSGRRASSPDPRSRILRPSTCRRSWTSFARTASDADLLRVRRLGLGPRTTGLKGRCSTIELAPRTSRTIKRNRLSGRRSRLLRWLLWSHLARNGHQDDLGSQLLKIHVEPLPVHVLEVLRLQVGVPARQLGRGVAEFVRELLDGPVRHDVVARPAVARAHVPRQRLPGLRIRRESCAPSAPAAGACGAGAGARTSMA